MTAVQPPGGSGFFTDEPFGTTIAVPFQNVAAAAGVVQTLGPIDCTAYEGARFDVTNVAGGGITIVDLRYFDDQSLTNIVADRWLMLSPAGAGTLDVTLPHLGDWLQIRLFTIDVNPLNVNVSVAQRRSPVTQWNLAPQFVLGKPTTPTNVLAMGVNVAMPAGTNNLEGGGSGCNGIYSGPAHLWLATPSTSSVKVFIQQRDINNTYQTNVEVAADANGLANLDFFVWPMGCGDDIRIHAVNGGVASTLSWTITADEYRVGG